MLSQYTALEVRVREFGRKVTHLEEGARIVEYLLLVVFIALLMITALATFRGGLSDAFNNTTSKLKTGSA